MSDRTAAEYMSVLDDWRTPEEVAQMLGVPVEQARRSLAILDTLPAGLDVEDRDGTRRYRRSLTDAP
jgi:hypothetical protein